MYTQDVCAACNRLKIAMVGNGIEFDIKNIDKDPAYKEELAATGYMATPVTAITDGDNTHYVSGNNIGEIQEVLNKLYNN